MDLANWGATNAYEAKGKRALHQIGSAWSCSLFQYIGVCKWLSTLKRFWYTACKVCIATEEKHPLILRRVFSFFVRLALVANGGYEVPEAEEILSLN